MSHCHDARLRSDHGRLPVAFHVSKSGEAVVVGKQQPLVPYSLIVIDAGEAREIRNTGDTPLEMLPFYTLLEY